MSSSRTYWFGPKRFGWGVSPKTWQGWVSILVYVALMILSSLSLFHLRHDNWEITFKIVLTGAFFGLMVWKYSPQLE